MSVPQPSWRLGLLGGFVLVRDGRPVPVASAEARVLAYVALRGRRRTRREVAGTLWPSVPEDRAAANLRTTLWRRHKLAAEALSSHAHWLELHPHVLVDVEDDARYDSWELLPDWTDEWLVLERERVRQRRLHSTERLATELLARQRHADALDLALQLVAADPLRESSHRLVIAVHLAEGNAAEAWRHYTWCRKLLAAELGTPPSAMLRELVQIQDWSPGDRRVIPTGPAAVTDGRGGQAPASRARVESPGTNV